MHWTLELTAESQAMAIAYRRGPCWVHRRGAT